jgi:type IV pilus assembly protein PilB
MDSTPALNQVAAPSPLATAPKLTNDDRAKEEQLAAKEAAASGFPYLDSRNLTEFPDVTALISLEVLHTYGVAPLHRFNDHSLELGLTPQTDRTKLPELQRAFPGIQLTFKTISNVGYNSILNHLYYQMFQAERDGNFKVFGDKLAKSAPKQAFQYIAQLAFWLGASDIHIEPQAERVRIRFRLDGVLHPITTVGLEAYKIFLSDLQTRAEIKWGSNEPQSGRISFNLTSHESTVVPVNMRIETIPTFHGEEIVVRIFNTESRSLQLEKMGFAPEQITRLDAIISHPNGLVLTVGPTGSGKTSTLYGIINRLNSPETKIITLEDPVEFDMSGISQIPVHTEDTESFAEKLRAVMREDPNVVMIGEIRDVDTAKTALQAALTGHLVLSTFHATNAAAAISRMLDMIGTNPLFASAVRLIVAQRLARRVCTHCKEDVAATAEQLAFIKAAIGGMPTNRRSTQQLNAWSEATTPDKAPKLQHGTGCSFCHGLGYSGRIGIIEMMPITPEIEKLMMSSTNTTAQDIEAKAVAAGMATLLEDGLEKALAGITTIDEIISLTVA